METFDYTTVNALGLTFTFFMAVMLFVLPRRFAPIPMLMIGAYMTYGQIVYVFGLHFTMMRVMILIGLLRILIKAEVKNFKANKLDIAFLCWLISHVSIYVLRENTTEALIYQLGFAYNTFGLYLFFRCLIRDIGDYEVVSKSLAIIIIPLAGLMLYELATGRNLFSVFGDVPEYTVIRGERLRCQGPFRHPILAGTFGATLFPIFISLYFKQGAKYLSILALIAAVVIVGVSASSGPLLALIGAIVALTLWPFRKLMREIRWSILIILISLHLYMKAPVWYLLSRISEIFGGTGWHRAELINQAIVHINEWWLFGMDVSETTDWLPYYGILSTTQVDVTNQYISEGIIGGMITMILFISIIIFSFSSIGNALAKASNKIDFENMVLWCTGAGLFAHFLSFFSVTYFDQIQIYWFMLLAIVTAIAIRNNKELVKKVF